MLGLKWRRQHPIGPFVVDFCCAEARVIVEIDGSVHLKPDKAAYDNARTAWLEAQGWRVLRIRNNDIDRDRLRAIIEPMTRRMRPPSPHRGEGERG